MAGDAQEPGVWREAAEGEFYYIQLPVPALPPDAAGVRREAPFEVFLIDVKSDSDIGRRAHVDPVLVFAENIRELGLDPDTLRKTRQEVRATILRTNAEIPANPFWRHTMLVKQEGSVILYGIEFKEEPPAG
jgi:hypothetical protein